MNHGMVFFNFFQYWETAVFKLVIFAFLVANI